MTPTAWDRAHAKSCWARGSVATDVPLEVLLDRDGAYKPFHEVTAVHVDESWKQRRLQLAIRITAEPEIGRYSNLPGGTFAQWLPVGSGAFWEDVFAERRRNAFVDAHQTRARPPHVYGYDVGRGDSWARGWPDFAERAQQAVDERRRSPPPPPRHEDQSIPYERLSPDEKKKRAKSYLDRLKETLNRRADGKRK